jgi:pimeloyl-ACP methyl ester carboxylesterase
LNGKPILHFHGHPSSRIEIRFFAKKLKELGIHGIAVDRPGVGLSDFKLGQTLLEWPDDVIELANHLRLDKFAVEGLSGGGPYAVTCAFKIPERLTYCGIISGMGLINWSKGGMMRSNRIGFFIARRLPFLIKTLVKAQKKLFDDREKLEDSIKNLPKPDSKLLQNPDILDIFIEASKEAFHSGLDGVIHEEKIYAKSWGFDLKDIPSDLQVYVWYGDMDVFVPSSFGRKMCELIPNCKSFFFPNEGHLSVFVNHLEEILETLKS